MSDCTQILNVSRVQEYKNILERFFLIMESLLNYIWKNQGAQQIKREDLHPGEEVKKEDPCWKRYGKNVNKCGVLPRGLALPADLAAGYRVYAVSDNSSSCALTCTFLYAYYT